MDLKTLKTKKAIIVSMQEQSIKDGQIVTNGGRVLGITATGKGSERSAKERLCSYRVDFLCQ